MEIAVQYPRWTLRNPVNPHLRSQAEAHPILRGTEDAYGVCSVDGCELSRDSRGLCALHYERLRRSGSTDDPVRGRPQMERFWEKVDKSGDCWNWIGAVRSPDGRFGGYGVFTRERSSIMQAHRFAWEVENGPIPKGLVIDHICHNRRCVRVEHLRLATLAQNAQNLKPGSTRGSLGVRGVTRRKNGRFAARTWHEGVSYSGGVFDTLAEAEIAAIALRNKLFTHNDADRQ